jgi:hypothetical protein
MICGANHFAGGLGRSNAALKRCSTQNLGTAEAVPFPFVLVQRWWIWKAPSNIPMGKGTLRLRSGQAGSLVPTCASVDRL